MITTDIQATLVPLLDAFEKMGVPYQIGGSVASSVYGIARTTLDIDVVANFGPELISPLVERLKDIYYIDEEQIREALHRRSSFNIIHLITMLKVDIFFQKNRPYDQQAFGKSQKETLDESEDARKFFLSSPEDVILNKLEWYLQGGCISDRQWNDVLGVLKIQGRSLDFGYMRAWASQLGLAELLGRAMQDAGLS